MKVVKAQTDTLLNVKNENGIKKINVLKLDIEGAEIAVLNSLCDEDLVSIDQISVEFHEFLDEGLRLPTETVIKRMENLGFRVIIFSMYKYSDVLFLNGSIKLSVYQKFWYQVHRLIRYKGQVVSHL
jgi:hypothetical protein